jgi:arylformamidase
MIKAQARLHFPAYAVDVDLDSAFDLSWPVAFGHEDPSAFSLPKAKSQPVRVGSFVGDTSLGGSVNCHTLEITPHGNGTHTEGIGHILGSHDSVLPTLNGAFVPATVLSVCTETLAISGESYAGNGQDTDRVVTASALKSALRNRQAAGQNSPGESMTAQGLPALVVRTKDEKLDKTRPRFSGENPPYFSQEAMETIVAWNVQHLLTDLPSVDREDCGGHTPNHRVYWGITDQPHVDCDAARKLTTITEMINPLFSSLSDGQYLLQIHVSPLVSDAILSRPFLFPILPCSPASGS